VTPPAFGTPPRQLTVGERGRLAQYVILIAAADTDAEHHQAIAVAINAAREMRHSGVAWDDIADGLGVTPTELWAWRAGAGRPTTSSPPAPFRFDVGPPGLLTALAVTGDATVNGNDFGSEVAAIRKALASNGSVIERHCIEIAELRREIDNHRPTVVHLAAHADIGGICVSLNGAPMAVIDSDLAIAIRAAAHRPRLVVLSYCDSENLARMLTGSPADHVEAAIGWRGKVTDPQARTFASLFYQRLHDITAIVPAFDDAQLTVTARWPDQAAPHLFTCLAATVRISTAPPQP
jgi:hypothetical protein